MKSLFTIPIFCLFFSFTAIGSERVENFYGLWKKEVGRRLDWAMGAQIYVRQKEEKLNHFWAAEILEVHQTLASAILRGDRPMSLEQGVLVASKLGVDIGWLLAFDEIRRRIPVSIDRIPFTTYRNFKPIIQQALQMSERELRQAMKSPCLLLLSSVSAGDLVAELSRRRGRKR
jgi:hypothetical protein